MFVMLTWAISSGVVTALEIDLRLSTTASTAIITPRLISTGLEPLLIDWNPSVAMARASTVAQVVPSPA